MKKMGHETTKPGYYIHKEVKYDEILLYKKNFFSVFQSSKNILNAID